ncbi:MAG: SDR family oxidoreductase [Xanthomonadales bacterium]|nr:SDR family oxidoreductase [Xanthomonadales bacterium]
MPAVLVTGANRGLGLGFARAFAGDGWDVIAVVRNGSPELEALAGDGVEIHLLDLCDDDELSALPARLARQPLDLLINNAGRMGEPKRQGFGHFDRAVWRDVFDINLFTPMRLAELLAPNLERAERPRIVTLSSSLASMQLNEHGGLYAYRASKAAVNAITKSLALDLQDRGIIAVALNPGWVRTDMGGSDAELDVETSVDGMLRVIAGLRPDDSGKFLSWDGRELPW